MSATNKVTAEEIICNLLNAYNITDVFASPGSRNASLLERLSADKSMKVRMIVDERQAAFSALGYSKAAGKPTVLLCTSGSALLNYGPAISEAYYSNVPLIVLSADRPEEWIDQDDSQTLRQPEAFRNLTKASYDLPVLSNDAEAWYVNRIFNEALGCAVNSPIGPVHINVQIDQPTASCTTPFAEHMSGRTINALHLPEYISVAEARALSASLASPRKVMIVVGFMPPSSKINRALSRFAELPNVVVLTETISNLHSRNFINSIDCTLRCLPEEPEEYLPDVVITLGGALVSRRIKALLREHPPVEHWFIGQRNNLVDCFRCLTKVINASPESILGPLASAMQIHEQPSDYRDIWQRLYQQGQSILQSFTAMIPWSDMKALATAFSAIPRNWNLQLSNGTPVRYSQLFATHQLHRVDCNRGVSGIDGCTSTAIGAMTAYKGTTLLISGDTSAFYDMSALGSPLIDSRFKMIVVNNCGGGIFRYIKATRESAVLEDKLCPLPHFPLRALAESFGFRYFRADKEEMLRTQLKEFISETSAPCMLEIVTPAKVSAELLSQFLDTRLTQCLQPL